MTSVNQLIINRGFNRTASTTSGLLKSRQGCKKFIFQKISGVDLPAVLGGEGGLLLGRVHVGPEGPLGVRAALVLQGAQLDLVQPGGTGVRKVTLQ